MGHGAWGVERERGRGGDGERGRWGEGERRKGKIGSKMLPLLNS
jgi:hypothetical protein